jgi:hypothetical protein
MGCATQTSILLFLLFSGATMNRETHPMGTRLACPGRLIGAILVAIWYLFFLSGCLKIYEFNVRQRPEFRARQESLHKGNTNLEQSALPPIEQPLKPRELQRQETVGETHLSGQPLGSPLDGNHTGSKPGFQSNQKGLDPRKSNQEQGLLRQDLNQVEQRDRQQEQTASQPAQSQPQEP